MGDPLMTVSIRIAGPEDAAAVRRVLEDSYPQLMAGAYDPQLLARALPLILRPHPRLLAAGTYFLAEQDGEPVGCGGWSLERPGEDSVEPGLAHIRHFAVRAGWAGRGVGRALYERCEQDARTAGATRLEAQASLNGEPFYAALGFVRIGPIDVAMGPDLDFPSILMVREI
jgi:GNAT superfamily N-acetyltransferase